MRDDNAVLATTAGHDDVVAAVTPPISVAQLLQAAFPLVPIDRLLVVSVLAGVAYSILTKRCRQGLCNFLLAKLRARYRTLVRDYTFLTVHNIGRQAMHDIQCFEVFRSFYFRQCLYLVLARTSAACAEFNSILSRSPS